jgi:hypothetical protein
MLRVAARAVLVLLPVAPLASPALAQTNWRLSAGAGVLAWDASGTGESATIVARAGRAIFNRWLGVELGAGYAALDEQFGTTSTKTLSLDGQFQLQAPWTRLQPYVGVGPALFSYLTQPAGRDRVEPGFSVGAGLRAQVTRRIGLVADARIRGWNFERATDFTVNSAGEATLGVTIRP